MEQWVEFFYTHKITAWTPSTAPDKSGFVAMVQTSKNADGSGVVQEARANYLHSRCDSLESAPLFLDQRFWCVN